MSAPTDIALSKLQLDHQFWRNPRSFTGLDDKSIAEFGKELKERADKDNPSGILSPLTVQQIAWNDDVLNLVIDGQRRFKAALDVWPATMKVPVVFRTEKPVKLDWALADEILLEVLAMGQKREGLSSFELSDVAERMRNRNRTIADIAYAIGRSESWVSKMLKARATASPALMISWKKGEITDEQFKDLAEIKDTAKQDSEAGELVKARAAGDKAEARIRAKELKEEAKAKSVPPKKEAAKKTNGHAITKADGGEQVEMWQPPPPVAQKKTLSAPPRHALEDMVSVFDKRPATHDYVKGIRDALKFAVGQMDASEFGKPWRAYLERVTGKRAAAKGKKAKSPPKGKRVTWDAKAKKERKAKRK